MELEAGRLERGDLQDQSRRRLLDEPAEDPADDGDDEDVGGIEAHGPERAQVEGDEGQDDRRPGRAWDKGNEERGQDAVAARLEDPGGDDGRDVAAEAEDERRDRLAVEPDAVHEGVEEEARPGQVAEILERRHEEQEGQEIRQDDGHPAADPLDEPLGEMEEEPVPEARPQRVPQLVERPEQERFERIADLEDDDKKGHEDRGQDDIAEHGVHEDGVDLLVPRHPLAVQDAARLFGELHGLVMALRRDDLVRGRAAVLFDGPPGAVDGLFEPGLHVAEKIAAGVAGGLDELDGREAGIGDDREPRRQEALDLGDLGLDVVREADRLEGLAFVQDVERPVKKLADAAAVGGDGRDDGDAEEPLRLDRVELDAPALGDVDHVEGDNHGIAELDELERELEAAAQRRGVDDVDDEVGFLREQVRQDDLLGRVGRAERVGPGQVDDVDETPLDGDPAVGVLDGCAGEVRGLGLGAGDGVEERALAAVRLSDEDDGGDLRTAHGRLRRGPFGRRRGPGRRSCPTGSCGRGAAP